MQMTPKQILLVLAKFEMHEIYLYPILLYIFLDKLSNFAAEMLTTR